MIRFLGALAAMLLVPAAALAYVPSPQNGAFELKFGPFTPNVDDEPGVASPYADTFHDDWMLATVLELDWQIVHPPGFSLGVGGQAGFMQAYAKSVAETSTGTEESGDYTVLNVVPFAALVVLRIDALADYLDVPLVPYAKVGLAYSVWWVLAGGEVAKFDGRDASGGTMGWQFQPGLMFRLDQFDSMSARTFDNEVGVNHSYIFAELWYASLAGLGGLQDDAMRLGDTTFLAGLALEF